MCIDSLIVINSLSLATFPLFVALLCIAVLHSMHSRDIHFLLFYSIWTLRTTPIQLVSVLFIAALYTVPTLI